MTKIECMICDKKNLKNLRSLLSHLRTHNISSKEYYDKYMKKENEGICKNCEKNTSFNKLSKGYFKFCSCKCSANFKETKRKRKNTNIEKYGVENIFQSEDIKEKIKQTNINKYGFERPLKNEEIQKKFKQTCLNHYGFNNPSKSDDIKNKKKKTCFNNHGTNYPLQSEKIREKIKQTCLNRYSVENIFQSEDIKEKIKQSNINKYGVEHLLQNKNIIEKIKQTNINKYGCEYPLQNKEIKEKYNQTCLDKYGCENPSKNEDIKDKIKKINLEKQIKKVKELFKYLGIKLLSEYKDCRKNIKLKCLKCDIIFYSNYFNLYQGYGKCPNCFPTYKSNCEIELLEFIRSIETSEIIENDRNILNGKELDIYIPSKNIAIEFDGLYWHSEERGKDKYYHLNKTKLCESKNIKLIHIFEDEWIFKQDIVKYRLKQLLKVNNVKRIHTRKCKIKEIDYKIKNEFLNKYHIQGEDKSNIKLGAFYNGELISVMTFSKGNISKGSKAKDDIYELNRFCSNSNYNIPGVASKLLSYFKQNYKWKEIYSYADRRWSIGNLYKKIGFELESITEPNYFYIKGLNRIHRFNLRKRISESKDIPEWVLRQKEGYYRIWDCGHYKFKMRI